MSPTARTLAFLKKNGWQAGVVERTIHGRIGGKRIVFKRDLFGYGDILAWHPGIPGELLVQACMTGDASRRMTKALANGAGDRVRPGRMFCVMGWGKYGDRGERKLWHVRVLWLENPYRPEDLRMSEYRDRLPVEAAGAAPTQHIGGSND